jgi:8-oxo-dGTP pyrophosphatase MutT (NUDIX family)
MSPPDLLIVEKVGACIIRRNQAGLYELLLFSHADLPEVSVQIPGGSVEVGMETIEEAVHREVLEESGLRHLRMIRKIAEWRWPWPEKKVLIDRHVYLLEAPPETPDTWVHLVTGSGSDAQLRFAYHWLRPSSEFRLGGGFDPYLNKNHLPEFYP